MIYFSSDFHFCHNKPFIYESRGFSSVQEMNDAIFKNWNSIVKQDDEAYVLGDLMLMNNEEAMKYILHMNGKIKIILGNHDTLNREAAYVNAGFEVAFADQIKYNQYHFFLSHYPTLTNNFDYNQKSLKRCLLNLYGHTHQKEKFHKDNPYLYHVGVDSHNLKPVSIEQVISDMENNFVSYKKNEGK